MTCNSTNCITCNVNFVLVGNQCACQNDRVLLSNGSCQFCNLTFGYSCTACSTLACTLCSKGFTINATLGNCFCSNVGSIIQNG